MSWRRTSIGLFRRFDSVCPVCLDVLPFSNWYGPLHKKLKQNSHGWQKSQIVPFVSVLCMIKRANSPAVVDSVVLDCHPDIIGRKMGRTQIRERNVEDRVQSKIRTNETWWTHYLHYVDSREQSWIIREKMLCILCRVLFRHLRLLRDYRYFQWAEILVMRLESALNWLSCHFRDDIHDSEHDDQ